MTEAASAPGAHRPQYVVGVDYGTLSGRALVVRVSDGAELGSAVHEYAHAVVTDRVPVDGGASLPPEWALQVPQDYRDLVARLRARGLVMICAHPDVVVERGDQLVYCAGAVADLYAESGGEVIYAGKPYRPIYAHPLA